MNINDHRADLAQHFHSGQPDIECSHTEYARPCEDEAGSLLASPALARLLAAARDEARAEGNPCRSGCALMAEAVGDWDGVE